jgi:hypothetical protein
MTFPTATLAAPCIGKSVRRGGKVYLILSHQPETIFVKNGELVHAVSSPGQQPPNQW